MPPQYFNFDPHLFPEDYLRALGFLNACTAQTEELVQLLIGALLGADLEKAAAVTAHMNAPMRDQSLRSLAEIRIVDTDWLDELDGVLDRLNDLLAIRNKYVHNSFGIEVATGQMFFTEISARGSVKASVTPVKSQEIIEIAEEIYTIGMKLTSYVTRVEHLSPLLPEQRNRLSRTRSERKKAKKLKQAQSDPSKAKQ